MKAAGSALQAIGGGFVEVFPVWVQHFGLDAAFMYACVWQVMDAFYDDMKAIKKNEGWVPIHYGWLTEMNLTPSWIENQLIYLQSRGRLKYKLILEKPNQIKPADAYVFLLAGKMDGLLDDGFIFDTRVKFKKG